jgi:hypothetical protein
MANFMSSRALKINFFCVLVFLCSCAKDTVQLQGAHSSIVIDENGHPTAAMARLLEVLAVKHDGTLKSIVDATQKQWLRPAGTERWELVDTMSAETIEQVKPLFKELGFIDEVRPSKKHYTYALLLGSRESNFIHRLAYLIDNWNKGMRFDQLVLLAGQRDLMEEETLDVVLQSDAIVISDHEELKSKWSSVKTEKDMMQEILAQCVLPKEMREKTVITVVDAPKKLVAGKLVRPTTGDTVNAWMEKNPAPGSCVAISSQPHVLYQQAVLASLLPKNFSVETIGRQGKSPKIAEVLDAVARFLYQEQKLRQK